jgi:hypothetical protein
MGGQGLRSKQAEGWVPDHSGWEQAGRTNKEVGEKRGE